MKHKIGSYLIDLIKNNITEKSLIIVLGESSRQFIETELKTLLVGDKDKENEAEGLTINEIQHLHDDIKILFLNRLQYLFMYLTHLEVDKGVKTMTMTYDNIIIFGLDQLLSKNGKEDDKETDVIRLSQLILNCFYSLPRRYTNMNKLISIPFEESETEETAILTQIDSYCKYINGIT
ncbi:suppressor of HU sensitivity involved in recombination protein 1 [Monosporozyma servazzii]